MVGGVSDATDDVLRAVLALGDQLSPSPPPRLSSAEDARDRQETPEAEKTEKAAASEPLAAAETEPRDEQQQQLDLHYCSDTIASVALAAASQLAPGRPAIEGERGPLLRGGFEKATENSTDSFYFNLGRSMVQDSFGSGQEQGGVDTASVSSVCRRSFGWDATGGVLRGVAGR